MYMENNFDPKLINALGRTYRSAQIRSLRLLYHYGLTMPQFTVLEVLYNKGAMTVKSIIETVLSSGGSMTVVIRNLEQQGLVAREENTADRRSYLISITEQGRSLMESVLPLCFEDIHEMLSVLTEKEKKALYGYLIRLSGDTADSE